MQEHLCSFLFNNYKAIDAKATIFTFDIHIDFFLILP